MNSTESVYLNMLMSQIIQKLPKMDWNATLESLEKEEDT